MVDQANLDDVNRRLAVIEHELTDISGTHPANGAEVTIAMRKVQEAILYVTKAKEKQG
jgi:hypothetical protein